MANFHFDHCDPFRVVTPDMFKIITFLVMVGGLVTFLAGDLLVVNPDPTLYIAMFDPNIGKKHREVFSLTSEASGLAYIAMLHRTSRCFLRCKP